MQISVNREWFSNCHSSALAVLGEIGTISGSRVDFTGFTSAVGKELMREYEHLCNTVASIVNAMASDWNAAKVCVANINHFDTYISRMLNNENISHLDEGSASLWRTGNADDSHLIVEGHFSLGFLGFDDYISSDCISDLSVFCANLNSMGSKLDSYSAIVAEIASAEDFSGRTFEAIKNYMNSVHSPIISYMKSVVTTFSEMISAYQRQYQISMPDDNYRLKVDDLIQFRQKLNQSYRELRGKIDEFNHYVYSQNAQYDMLSLDEIAYYCIDNVQVHINAQISELDGIIETIENIETNSEGDFSEVREYINILESVLADLGTHSGFRMISPNRQFESISSLGNISEREFRIYDFYFDYLTNGNSTQRRRAADYFRNNIIENLIESFSNRSETSYYNYNLYSGYDVGVLSPMINSINFNDVELMRNWRCLFNSMLADGYTDINALRFSEIAMLFNEDGIRSYSGSNGGIDDVIIPGICQYVVSYSGYIADTPRYGYNQVNRWANFNDFDCSSLVIAAYEKAFIDMRFALNEFGPEVNSNAYLHIGSEKIVAKENWEDYGFRVLEPNKDVSLDSLAVGDIFAIDKDDNSAHHVEVFAGKFDDGEGRIEYLNISAHSSDRIFGVGGLSNNNSDNPGDQLQQNGLSAMLDVPEGGSWGTFIHDTACVGEEGVSIDYDAEAEEAGGNNPGIDHWRHDRIGEIRYENIGPRPEWGQDPNSKKITGYLKWTVDYVDTDEGEKPVYTHEDLGWDRVIRLNSMEYWKTH